MLWPGPFGSKVKNYDFAQDIYRKRVVLIVTLRGTIILIYLYFRLINLLYFFALHSASNQRLDTDIIKCLAQLPALISAILTPKFVAIGILGHVGQFTLFF